MNMLHMFNKLKPEVHIDDSAPDYCPKKPARLYYIGIVYRCTSSYNLQQYNSIYSNDLTPALWTFWTRSLLLCTKGVI